MYLEGKDKYFKLFNVVSHKCIILLVFLLVLVEETLLTTGVLKLIHTFHFLLGNLIIHYTMLTTTTTWTFVRVLPFIAHIFQFRLSYVQEHTKHSDSVNQVDVVFTAWLQDVILCQDDDISKTFCFEHNV